MSLVPNIRNVIQTAPLIVLADALYDRYSRRWLCDKPRDDEPFACPRCEDAGAMALSSDRWFCSACWAKGTRLELALAVLLSPRAISRFMQIIQGSEITPWD